MAARHITMVFPGFGRTGGSLTLLEYANRLAADSVRVTVVSPSTAESRSWLSPAVEVRRVKPQRLWDAVHAALRRVFGPHERLKSDPFLCAPLIPRGSQVINCFAPFDDRLFAHPPALTYLQHWEPVWFGDDPDVRAAVERRMHSVSAGIANSSWLLGHYPAERRGDFSLVFPGVDLETFTPRREKSASRSGKPLRIVALGREEPIKGLADLRAAAASLDEPVELFLFGSKDRRHVAGRIPEHHLGHLSPEDLADLYRSADVVVTPSWFESFPLPPLEAMACGASVVTSRQGTEDFAVDGENAHVFDGGDQEGLADALRRAIAADHGTGAAAAAARSTAEQFTWENGYQMLRRALVGRGVLA